MGRTDRHAADERRASHRRSRHGWVVACGLALASSTARAAGPEPDPAAVREAEQRYEEGKQLFGQRKWSEALLKFTQACAVHRTTNCARNLAATEMELGHDPEVVMHLREYFRQPDVPKDDSGTLRLRQVLAETYGRTGHIHLTAPEGAAVKVDDVAKGKAPLGDPLDVRAGRHQVVAVLGSGKTVSATVDANAGVVVDVTLRDPDTRTAVVASPTRMRYVVPAIVLGAAALSLIGGIYFSELSVSDNDKVWIATHDAAGRALPRSTCTGAPPSVAECESLRNLQSTQSTHATLGDVFYVSSAVLAAGAVVTYVLWPHARASTQTAFVAPAVSAEGGGLRVFGRF